MKMVEQFNAVRRAAAPIVAINTPDPASTIRDIRALNSTAPTVQWNIVDGVSSMNSLANAAVAAMHTVEGQLMPAALISSNPVEALRLMKLHLPNDSISFMHNAHFYAEPTTGDAHKPVIQGIWNLRDKWKNQRSTLVMLAPGIQMPPELRNDVALIDEQLPTEKEMEAIVARGLARGESKPVGKRMKRRLVAAVRGLSAFNAEGVIAMGVNHKTRRPEMEMVWEHKIKLIEQTRGLKVYRKGPTFADIAGSHNIKTFLSRMAKGKWVPDLVVFLDEFEKTLRSAQTESSGTTADQQKTFLVKMEDNQWRGVVVYGFSGTGKSFLAKAFGNEVGVPTVEADLGGMKNMWVGSSEQNMRAFIKTIEAMGGKKVFFIATCNSLVELPPEVKRRFWDGIWFGDIPNRQEKDDVWAMYRKIYAIPGAVARPNDDGWTQSEIKLCCLKSSEMNISLNEASKYLTITTKAMGDQGVEQMRIAASGKYLSTEHPGVYVYNKQ